MSLRDLFLPLLLICCVGCSVPLRQARLDPLAAPTAVEIDAGDRMRDRTCGPTVGYLWPGIGQACTGRPAEAAFLAGLAAAEAGAGITAYVTVPAPSGDALFQDTGRMIPLIGLQNLWTYSVSRSAIDRQLAQWKPYTPQDTLEEMIRAPFNVQVLKRPEVLGGITVLTGAAVALNTLGARRVPGKPDLFGVQTAPGVGIPVAAALGTVTFQHVAIGEEIAFRGLIQSGLVRATHSEYGGWAVASLIFGAVHAQNAAALGPDAKDYLLYAVPYITLTGSYLGLSYKWSGYSLAPPIAIHFWYDFLLSAADFAMDPEHNMFSARVVLPL